MSHSQPLFSVLDTASEHATSAPGKESATDSRLHGTRDALSTGTYIVQSICMNLSVLPPKNHRTGLCIPASVQYRELTLMRLDYQRTMFGGGGGGGGGGTFYQRGPNTGPYC